MSKLTKLVFIPKPNKSHSDPFNYRPISLLNIIGKQLEKILTQRLLYFMEHHNLFSEFQFGFRKSRSTQIPIQLLASAVAFYQNKKHASILSTRDVYKAFDTVWWRGLIFKINALPGDQSDLCSLMYNYLSRRKIVPIFQGTRGNEFIPKSGVPQGSSLGPVLYLIYVNDIPSPKFNTTIRTQFADDIVHFTISTNKKSQAKGIRSTNIQYKTEKELERTLKWEQDWKIKSNTTKSEILIFGGTENTLRNMGGIQINEEDIKIVGSSNILGYRINKSTTHSAHIKCISGRATKELNKLYRFRHAPPKIKLILYKTLIRPLIEYPSIILPTASDYQKNKLQIVQNKALRFIYNIHWSDFVTNEQLHNRAKIPRISERLNKLREKAINKLKDLINVEERAPYYSLSDYIIEDDPINEPSDVLKQLCIKLRII